MHYLKKHLSIIVALALPVFMVFFIAGAVYLPAFFNHPVTDFLYTTGDSYCGIQYFVQYQKIAKSENNCPGYTLNTKQAIKLFLHNTKENSSQQISFEQAEQFILEDNIISPEGYRIEYGTHQGGFFPFFMYSSSDYNSVYLTNKGISYKLNINNSGSYPYMQFRFLGWIIK